ncbi:MAG: Glu/Leu/Phe/Val dehydrogenase [Actinobacteria bacterium]|nr:Glu/Leu/Phe/Val dehydrogenase [Actinomycetota bacterium]
MDAPLFDHMRRHRFKKVVLVNDTASGLRGAIAIHSTVLGPATGGLRIWPYADERAAILDAMRLAVGMTYKYAAAGLDFGGGKAVLIGDPRRDKSEAMLRALGRMIDGLGGEYVTGEDVGTTLADMETIYAETDHVLTLPEHCGGAGDISPATALGVLEAMRACAKRAWGSPELAGRRVALQGLGVVGSQLLRLLDEAGAKVIACDLDPEKVARAEREHGVETVAPESIYDQDVDVFAPCALGAVLDDETIPRLRAGIVAGAANNVFAAARHAAALQERGIVYAVDFIANAGGTIYDSDRLRKGGFQTARAWAGVHRIFARTEQVHTLADAEGLTYQRAAERIAERRLEALSAVRLLDPPQST